MGGRGRKHSRSHKSQAVSETIDVPSQALCLQLSLPASTEPEQLPGASCCRHAHSCEHMFTPPLTCPLSLRLSCTAQQATRPAAAAAADRGAACAAQAGRSTTACSCCANGKTVVALLQALLLASIHMLAWHIHAMPPSTLHHSHSANPSGGVVAAACCAVLVRQHSAAAAPHRQAELPTQPTQGPEG